MEEKTIALGVLVIVAVIALCSCALIYKNSTALAVYEQPANNKPLFLTTSTYVEDFNLCKQYICGYTFGSYGEGEHADIIGVEEIEGNLICGCPDGRSFQIRPDRIEVETF
jgi:hypothetical protein